MKNIPLGALGIYSYSEKLRIGLQQLGVTKGTRVGLLLPNCPNFIAHYFAAMKLGAVIVNYNPLYTIDELRQQGIGGGQA